MRRPTDVLMHEHRLIERVLDALEARLGGDHGSGIERRDIARFAEFFRTFADGCHHGKEEQILFERLRHLGMPAEQGPIAVMCHEHEIGRALVHRLRALADGDGPLAAEEQREIRNAGLEYAAMLRAHIQKEDRILFPMAERMMSESDRKQIGEAFEAFERHETGNGAHERMHVLAEELMGGSVR